MVALKPEQGFQKPLFIFFCGGFFNSHNLHFAKHLFVLEKLRLRESFSWTLIMSREWGLCNSGFSCSRSPTKEENRFFSKAPFFFFYRLSRFIYKQSKKINKIGVGSKMKKTWGQEARFFFQSWHENASPNIWDNKSFLYCGRFRSSYRKQSALAVLFSQTLSPWWSFHSFRLNFFSLRCRYEKRNIKWRRLKMGKFPQTPLNGIFCFCLYNVRFSPRPKQS